MSLAYRIELKIVNRYYENDAGMMFDIAVVEIWINGELAYSYGRDVPYRHARVAGFINGLEYAFGSGAVYTRYTHVADYPGRAGGQDVAE